MYDPRRHLLPFVLALLGLPAVAVAGEIPASADATDFPAYRVIAPGLAAGGQPSPAALGRLKQMGFRTVINLRTEQEGASQERAGVEAQGLRYVSIPISPATFSLADVEAVEKVLADAAARPVLLHCASANRVGAVWAVIQARQGKSREQALAAGAEAGMRPIMQEAVARVLGQLTPAAAAPQPTAPQPTAPKP